MLGNGHPPILLAGWAKAKLELDQWLLLFKTLLASACFLADSPQEEKNPSTRGRQTALPWDACHKPHALRGSSDIGSVWVESEKTLFFMAWQSR